MVSYSPPISRAAQDSASLPHDGFFANVGSTKEGVQHGSSADNGASDVADGALHRSSASSEQRMQIISSPHRFSVCNGGSSPQRSSADNGGNTEQKVRITPSPHSSFAHYDGSDASDNTPW
ncbi:hypothetical protein GOP47_0029220, partial [Adiantum capillus-veneris]